MTSLTTTLTDALDRIVALAAGPITLVELSDKNKRALLKLEKAAVEAANRETAAALKPVLERAAKLLAAGKTLDEILADANLGAALSAASSRLERFADTAIRKAWKEGAIIGRKHSLAEARLLGIDYRFRSAATSFLDALLADMGGLDITPRIIGVLNTAADRSGLAVSKDLDSTLKATQRRVAAGTSSAINRGYTETQLANMRSAIAAGYTIQKVWVANVRPTSCSACLALNGTVVEIEEEFDHSAGHRSISVYQDLLGPPRHPHCRCRIIAVTPAFLSTMT